MRAFASNQSISDPQFRTPFQLPCRPGRQGAMETWKAPARAE